MVMTIRTRSVVAAVFVFGFVVDIGCAKRALVALEKDTAMQAQEPADAPRLTKDEKMHEDVRADEFDEKPESLLEDVDEEDDIEGHESLLESGTPAPPVVIPENFQFCRSFCLLEVSPSLKSQNDYGSIHYLTRRADFNELLNKRPLCHHKWTLNAWKPPKAVKGEAPPAQPVEGTTRYWHVEGAKLEAVEKTDSKLLSLPEKCQNAIWKFESTWKLPTSKECLGSTNAKGDRFKVVTLSNTHGKDGDAAEQCIAEWHKMFEEIKEEEYLKTEAEHIEAEKKMHKAKKKELEDAKKKADKEKKTAADQEKSLAKEAEKAAKKQTEIAAQAKKKAMAELKEAQKDAVAAAQF